MNVEVVANRLQHCQILQVEEKLQTSSKLTGVLLSLDHSGGNAHI